MYHSFAVFYLKLSESSYTRTLINFDKFSLKFLKVTVVCKSFCEGFPNSAAHTS